jgi:hypothetical protein
MHFGQWKRREFFTLLGGAVAWPLAARAQQPNSIRRIGLLMMYPESDPQGELRAGVFQREIEKIGWKVGGNLQINFHWGTGNADWVRSAVVQILSQAPDVMLANGDAASELWGSRRQQCKNSLMCNAVGINQNADTGDLRCDLFEHIKQFAAQGRLHNRKAGDVAAWMRQARHQTIHCRWRANVLRCRYSRAISAVGNLC